VRAWEDQAPGAPSPTAPACAPGKKGYLPYPYPLRCASMNVRQARQNSHFDEEKLEWVLWSASAGEHRTLLDDLRH
jgi:hypothetical protein